MIERVEPDKWKEYDKSLHSLVFDDMPFAHELANESKPDFVLMHRDCGGKIDSYITCKEAGCKRVVVEFGGILKASRGRVSIRKIFREALSLLKKSYDSCEFLTLNTNLKMQIFGASMGFTPVGMRVYRQHTFLEYEIDLRGI